MPAECFTAYSFRFGAKINTQIAKTLMRSRETGQMRTETRSGPCTGLKEIRTLFWKCISRSAIVALSAQPPGVNKLCVSNARITKLLIIRSGSTDRGEVEVRSRCVVGSWI